LMNTCFRMKWEAMWWSFWKISIASAESFFMRVQYTQNANVCNPITITSDQKHCPALKFQPFKSSHLCSLATQKRNRMRSSGWNPLH